MLSFLEYMREAYAAANDNYNTNAANQNFSHETVNKWQKWMNDNPDHPARGRVAAKLQSAQKQLKSVQKRNLHVVGEDTVETKHLIPAVHVAGKTYLPKKRTDWHANIIHRMPQEHQDALDASDDSEKHIGFYHIKHKKFIPGHKTRDVAGHNARLDSIDLPYSTNYKENDIPKPKNRHIEVD